MYNIGIDGLGCPCDAEGCSLCAAPDESCETCGAVLTDANRGDGIGDLCATCLAAGVIPVVGGAPALVTRSSNPRRCAVCDEVKCGSVVLPDDTSVCDDCTVRELRNAIRLYAAVRRIDDGCGCSDADGPCSRHEVDEEGPRGSEAADALRDSQAAAQRSR